MTDTQPTKPKPPTREDYVRVDFSEPTEPFVFEIRGRFTLEAIEEIQNDLTDNPVDDAPCDAWFRATYVRGQFDEEGRCELPPGWELDQLLGEPPDDLEAQYHNLVKCLRMGEQERDDLEAEIKRLRGLFDRAMALLDTLGNLPVTHQTEMWPQAVIDERNALRAEVGEGME
jgi:hypothetical protein